MISLRAKLVDASIIFSVTILLLAGLELAARVHLAIIEDYFPSASLTVLKREWGKQYRTDESGLSWRHVAYVEFREHGYSSPTIHVDDQGRRLVPGNCEKTGALKVWMFGGSTMFGYGAPDQYTIPAQIAAIAANRSLCATVVNYGAGSWQSSQSVIQLYKALASGERPDVVVFYDGINEAENAVAGASPGGLDPSTDLLLKQAFGESHGVAQKVAEGSVLIQFILIRIVQVPQKRASDARARILSDIPARGKAVAGMYAENARVVEALAREYGFRAYFFLQPFPRIAGKKLTDLEKTMFDKDPANQQGDRKILRGIYAEFGRVKYLANHPRYFDISSILDGVDKELYADTEHLLPEGNRIVAERIAREILPRQGAR